MGGLQFAQDGEGKWGYKVGGADSVHPFNSGFGPFQHKNMTPTKVQDRVAAGAGNLGINLAIFETGITGKELYKTFFYIPLGSGIVGNGGSISSPIFNNTSTDQFTDTYDPVTGTLKLYGYVNRCNSVVLLWM